MFNSNGKLWCFIFEALGSLACGFYGNYVYFLFRDRYGFGNLGNLSVGALDGLVFAISAWLGGRFAQRRGCFVAIRWGLIGMISFLLLGSSNQALGVQLVVLVGWSASMCLIWPALEALVSENEPQTSLLQKLGVYNVVWATCSAVSYFFGGAIFEHLGNQSIYFLPTAVYFLMLVVLWRFANGTGLLVPARLSFSEPSMKSKKNSKKAHARDGRTFMHIAWLANPLACIAISTLLAMIPGLASELHLTTTFAGLFCSIWFFGRLASFILLWRWRGWHYRIEGLLLAFAGLVVGLVVLLVAHQLWILLLAQIVFGLSVGLIYYSSLFYSMDVGDTKAEHGGVHEAAMGLGNCLGPASGAAGLLLAPHVANASVYAVSGLLAVGFSSLVGLWCRRKRKRISAVRLNLTG